MVAGGVLPDTGLRSEAFLVLGWTLILIGVVAVRRTAHRIEL